MSDLRPYSGSLEERAVPSLLKEKDKLSYKEMLFLFVVNMAALFLIIFFVKTFFLGG